MRFLKIASVSLCLLMASQGSVFAQDEDPLNPAPSLMWLSSDVNVSVFGDNEYDSFLGSSELWNKNWGVSAQLLENSNGDIFGLPEDSSYFNLDVKRRLLGSPNKTNVELGLGWQELGIDSQLDASGPKVSLSGRYDVFDSFQVYGATSYFPELEDESLQTDFKAYEFEAGLLYKPLPSLSLKAGYRVFELDSDESDSVEDIGSSSGFLLGTDISW